MNYALFFVALLFTLYAQIMVKHNFKKYSDGMKNWSRMTGEEIARNILNDNGLSNVDIRETSGTLTDHFDPTTNIVYLSESVYDKNTIAAVGVAAHEVGHAIQYSLGYTPMRIRSAVIPATQIGSYLSYPLILLGLFFSLPSLIDIGIVCFSLVVFFQLITLPVEFNASRRAMEAIEQGGYLEKNQQKGTKKVLKAAAMTYVAALFTAVVNLLRLIYMRNGK